METIQQKTSWLNNGVTCYGEFHDLVMASLSEEDCDFSVGADINLVNLLDLGTPDKQMEAYRFLKNRQNYLFTRCEYFALHIRSSE